MSKNIFHNYYKININNLKLLGKKKGIFKIKNSKYRCSTSVNKNEKNFRLISQPR